MTETVSEIETTFIENVEKENATLPTEPLLSFFPNRIFINHVDSFRAKYIAAFITEQIVGASKIIGNLGDEAADEEEGQNLPKIDVGRDGTKYEFIGTLKEPYHKKTEDILFTISEEDENYLEEILKCGFVIFDIIDYPDEIPKVLALLQAIINILEEKKAVGPKTFENYNENRVLILLSTIMTWGATKPLDPDDPDVAFSEIDYRKRKHHPNYREHIECERELVLNGRLYGDKLKTYVIDAGLTYGHEGGDLDFLFRLAWSNEKYLPVFKPGNNFVPLIHVEDLAKVLHRLMENVPDKPQFILAVEQTPATLGQMVKATAKALGLGFTKEVKAQEAFLYKNITQKIFERYTVNVKMEPVFITENLQIEWKNELNFAENINNIAMEFRTAKNLKPLKVVLHGPPASGKTQLAKKICEHYNTHYVSVQSMLDDTLDELREISASEKARQKNKETRDVRLSKTIDEMDEMGEEEEVDLDEVELQIRDIITAMSTNQGHLPDEQLIKLMRTFLAKNICQNRGYVLDGFPETLQQARELFGQAAEAGGGAEEEAGDDEALLGNANNKIIPGHVISLQTSDEFLCRRVMAQPERVLHGTQYDEKNMLRRLAAFRQVNTEDNTVLNFFDEIEVHPVLLELGEDEYDDIEAVFHFILKLFGEPIGLGLSVDEELRLAALEKQNRLLQAEEMQLQQKLLEQKAHDDYHDKMERWTQALETIQMEEEKVLVARSEPLRFYLMKYVFPALTKGLSEVVRLKPEDPLDFLAEYLFRENPEGKMFDPSYTKDGELFLDQCGSELENLSDNA